MYRMPQLGQAIRTGGGSAFVYGPGGGVTAPTQPATTWTPTGTFYQPPPSAPRAPVIPEYVPGHIETGGAAALAFDPTAFSWLAPTRPDAIATPSVEPAAFAEPEAGAEPEADRIPLPLTTEGCYPPWVIGAIIGGGLFFLLGGRRRRRRAG